MVFLQMIVLISGVLFATTKSSMVELKSEWKPNFGWEVTCSWHLLSNDSLQSVRLSNADQQFMIYRPETDGSKRSALARLPNMEFHTDCYETQTNGVTGKCVISFDIYQPLKSDIISTCEVSGERPMFRVESKTIKIEAMVPPSAAVIEKINEESSTRVNVNCTSDGLPAPSLVWTIGDQQVPSDYSGGGWNFTSKLYHSWSSLAYTPLDSSSIATCTPEIVKDGRVLKGQPAQYSAACDMKGAVTVITSVITILALTR